MKDLIISLLNMLIFILVGLVITSIECNAQQIEWRYEYDTKESTIPGYFWIDQSGNGYYNILKYNSKNGAFDSHHSLLILNDKGEYNGSVYIKQCRRGGNLLPYNDDQYVMSGQSCEGYLSATRRSYLLGYDGKLIKEGRAFAGNYFALTPTSRGYTYFSKPTRNFSHTYLSIGYIDENFNITNDSIPLASLKREGLGMAFNYIAPVQLDNKNWVLPFNYGKVESGISIDHGSVICVEDEKIIWQYPDTISSYTLSDIDCKSNKITLLMRKPSNLEGKLFVKLDADGNVIESSTFRLKVRSIKEMKTHNNEIIILGFHALNWYDWKGNLIRELDLSKAVTSVRGMHVLDDGSVIIVGKQDAKSVILKVSNLGDTHDDVLEDEEMKDDKITYADVNFENKEAISVSVFPNPASIRINFEIKDQREKMKYRFDLFDQTGKQVFSDQFESNFYELELYNFNEGTFLYRIFTLNEKNPELISGKFIKINQ